MLTVVAKPNTFTCFTFPHKRAREKVVKPREEWARKLGTPDAEGRVSAETFAGRC